MTPSRVEQIKLKEMMKICPQKVNKTINLTIQFDLLWQKKPLAEVKKRKKNSFESQNRKLENLI